MPQFSQPLTIEDLVNENATFEPATHNAMRALARSKPWQGTFEKRWGDFAAAFAVLRDTYGLTGWTLEHRGTRYGDSGASQIDPENQTIRMVGRPSVVTLLQLTHKARQHQRHSQIDHHKAMGWSLSLFKRRFPISFSRCTLDPETGLMINEGLVQRDQAARSDDTVTLGASAA